jgi:PAS domain S-box-containing protein
VYGSRCADRKERRKATKAPTSWRRYAIALLAVGLAWVATLLLHVVAPERSLSLVFFFAAVTVSAGFGGIGPGVLATLLSALLCDYFFLTPFHSLAVARSDLPLLVLFVLVALLINGLSERLRTATRTADRRFQNLVQDLDVIVWEADPKTLRFTFVSQRAEEMLGYPVQRWLADRDFHREILSPDDCEEVLAWRREALRQGGNHTREYRVRTADRRVVWLRETLHVVCDERGQLRRLTGLCVDITERKQAFAQVQAGREHLQQLSRQLVKVQEAERRAIARELHDEIGQVLTGLKLSMEMALRLPSRAAETNLREALTLVNELMTHVDDLSLDLRPAMLDDLGLLPTLLWHFQRYSALTGVEVHCEHAGLERRFPPELETTAYRIVQEALTNVARHAGVREVTVRLWATRSLLGIQIRDRGGGFDPDKARADTSTGGLAGMEERANLLDGQLTVESSPGAGACLTAELPWNDPPPEAEKRLQ